MEGECRGERLAAGSDSCRLVKLHRVENRSDRAMIYGLGAHHGFRALLGRESTVCRGSPPSGPTV